MSGLRKRPRRLFAALTLIGGGGFMVVVATFVFAYAAVNHIASLQQAAAARGAVAARAWQYERELRPQAVWDEAYQNTSVVPDVDWMAKSYGQYLTDLLGYGEIYVIDGTDRPVFGFEDGVADSGQAFEADRPAAADLIEAVRGRKPIPGLPVATTGVTLADGTVLEYRGIADLRLVNGTPMDVIVETILPDNDPATAAGGNSPSLLIALIKLDETTIARFGDALGYADMRWIGGPGGPAAETAAEHWTVVASADGTPVGTLGWQASLPANTVLHTMFGAFVLAALLIIGVILVVFELFRRQMMHTLRSEADQARLARTDHLTGLGNRLSLSEALDRRLAALGDDGNLLGVLTIDLDRFKSLNDLFGHAAGDKALRTIGAMLQAEFPDGEAVRIGGDEFVLLVPATDSGAVAAAAARIVALLDTPLDFDHGDPFIVGGSVGYAVAPGDGLDGEDLLREADLALYAAKHQGRGRAVAYDRGMSARQLRKIVVEEALRRALDNDGISVAYQPLMASDGSAVLGVEALARWTDPELGRVSPAEFIPLAEETGLIVPLGEMVMRKAMTAGRLWPGISISVNVSSRQMQRVDMVATVRRLLEETGFAAPRLEIELTESILVTDDSKADAQIRGLQDLGVKVALDDFGTGYASLLYLRQFGFDKLKIDQQFVRDISSSVEARAMVMAMIEMGRSLDLAITAEGVETAEQASFLRIAGCDRLQGFHFAPPLSTTELDRFVDRWRTAA